MVTKAEIARMCAVVGRALAEHKIGKQYPSEFRDEVMVFAERRLAEGAALPQVAREIGISYWTVWGWLRTKRGCVSQDGGKSTEMSMVPVRVVEARPTSASRTPLTVHGPCGLRIEGADVETIAALVRRLA